MITETMTVRELMRAIVAQRRCTHGGQYAYKRPDCGFVVGCRDCGYSAALNEYGERVS
jgi:hypothetical protein